MPHLSTYWTAAVTQKARFCTASHLVTDEEQAGLSIRRRRREFDVEQSSAVGNILQRIQLREDPGNTGISGTLTLFVCTRIHALSTF